VEAGRFLVNKNLRSLLVCAGVPIIVFVAAVICGRARVFPPDGAMFHGLLFFWFLQPLSALICGIISGLKKYMAWFIFPFFVGILGAFAPVIASGSGANDLLRFFFVSFLPALIGVVLSVIASRVAKRHRENRSE
jgi:hypothetical protein